MYRSILAYIIAGAILVTTYQNCSATHESNSSLSSFEACNLVLKDEFSNGYHLFLETNCQGCHVSGGVGNGAFADANLDIAFDSFNVRGYQLVEQRALDPNHQPPYTGSQHQTTIDDLDTSWLVAKQKADTCIINSGAQVQNDFEDGIVPTDPQPTSASIETFVKLINADKDGTVIRWNLGQEILQPRDLSFANAQLEVRVTALSTITGEKSYIISKPKLKAGDQALHFQYFAVKINGQLIESATGFQQINRRVPANKQRDLATSSIVFEYDIRSTDVISIAIGRLEPITFDPPTFAELIDPAGVFGAQCLSCHDQTNPQGGFDISTRDSVIGQLMVSPYSPNNSELFKRMNDSANPMPQTGLLDDSSLEQVLWWIQDGAP